MKEKDNQEFLRKLDKIDQFGNKIMFRILEILYAAFTVCLLVATVYYGVCVIQGNKNTEQFINCCITLLIVIAIPVCSKLVDLFIKHFFKKDNSYDPRTIELPMPGTITLEDALHKMSTKTGVIVWDVIWGCVVFGLLCLLVLDNGNRSRIMFLCVCVFTFIAIGHIFFYFIWKKHSFIKKMLCNTAKCIAVDYPLDYVNALEESLKRGVLSYEKELILTDEYIIGCAGCDTSFTPVAIPREKIGEFVFFYKRIVNGRYSRTLGILSCRTGGKKLVDLVIGQSPKVNKILNILKYYDISLRKEEITYI